MNRIELKLLQSIRGYPSISILLPTHRTFPDNKQDPIRVKNLVIEAGKRLLDEMSKREAEPFLGRLQAIAEEVDYRYALDGLAIYVNRDFARKYYLPFSINERVVINETFATRDLVFALNRTYRYWVLVLSEQPTRLYEATREALIEVTENGFPLTHNLPGGETALPGGPGVKKSAYRDERHRQFFRNVDAELTKVLKQDDLPVVLVGIDRYLSFYNEITQNKGSIVASLAGSHDKTSAYELGELVWPLAKETFAAIRQDAFRKLDDAIGARRLASTVERVWMTALSGNTELLLVEEDFHYPGNINKNQQIEAVDDPTQANVSDDVVDEIIELVLTKGGKVVFVENGSLKDHSRIALITRYTP
jgi:hypothetical protein